MYTWNYIQDYLGQSRMEKSEKSFKQQIGIMFNPLNAEFSPICHLLALLAAHHILHVSRIRVKEESSKFWSTACVVLKPGH